MSFANSAIHYSLQQWDVIDSCYLLPEEERYAHGVWESHFVSLLPAWDVKFQNPSDAAWRGGLASPLGWLKRSEVPVLAEPGQVLRLRSTWSPELWPKHVAQTRHPRMSCPVDARGVVKEVLTRGVLFRSSPITKFHTYDIVHSLL